MPVGSAKKSSAPTPARETAQRCNRAGSRRHDRPSPASGGRGRDGGKPRAMRGLSLFQARHIPDRHDGALVGAASAASSSIRPIASTKLAAEAAPAGRSEERRVGKGCVSTCRSRWSPYHYKKQKNKEPTR